MSATGLLKIQNYIGGEFFDPVGGKYLDSFDPSTGEVWAKIPDSGSEDVDRAVSAAKTAFKTWSLTPVDERARMLLRLADLIESRAAELAAAESRDQGKPLWLARTVDIPRAVQNFRQFATSIEHHLDTSTYMERARALNYTTRTPVGVAVLISPWNLPLYLLTFKMAPALACGNTVVCKPSEFTSVTAWMLCDLCTQAGIPVGVVNMVFGTGPSVGHALTTHPDTPIISFTGSVATAQRIRSATAAMSKKLSLELGGKNAGIIFSDADLEKCISTTIRSSFLNQGEICLCTSRLFVQREIFSEFIHRFVQEAKKIRLGDPRVDDTWMGALISRDHQIKVQGYIDLAKDQGHKILCGDESLTLPAENQNGYFIGPTVIVDVPDSSRLMQEEIFGPVVCVVPFDEEAEVIDRANNVEYGLCATVWSRNVGKIHRVARQLQVGTVWANCWLVRDLHMPFGGVKSSGVGREGISDSLEFYTDVKTICVQID